MRGQPGHRATGGGGCVKLTVLGGMDKLLLTRVFILSYTGKRSLPRATLSRKR